MQEQFNQPNFGFRLLAALVVIGVIALIGTAVYRSGFNQGYLTAGATAAITGGGQAPAQPAPNAGARGRSGSVARASGRTRSRWRG